MSNQPRVYYLIEWLVPAENAIGGKPYWLPLKAKDNQFNAAYGDLDTAARAFAIEVKTHGRENIRMTKLTEEHLLPGLDFTTPDS